MGRHSQSYIARAQGLRTETPSLPGTSHHVGRIGLLAVALGIGIGALTGTAVASADTAVSNAGDEPSAQPSVETTAEVETAGHDEDDTETAEEDGSEAQAEAEAEAEAEIEIEIEIEAEVEAEVEVEVEVEAEEIEEEREPQDDSSFSRRATESDLSPSDEPDEPDDPAEPAPGDQASTDYGDIGKWMLERNGDIADYGGLPYHGKTVLEPVNVIIVDQTSRSSLEARWRLSAAMRRAGFPPRFFHSTGFRGLIDDVLYRQRPGGLLLGYSDNFFLFPNNHGRIFGPDPIETSTGYVWSGAFSTEEFTFYQGLPRHAYVSSIDARDALAGDFVASGRGTLGGMVALDNAFDTDAITTGDHDGYAVVIILGGSGAAVEVRTRVNRAATSTGVCAAAEDPSPRCPGPESARNALVNSGGGGI